MLVDSSNLSEKLHALKPVENSLPKINHKKLVISNSVSRIVQSLGGKQARGFSGKEGGNPIFAGGIVVQFRNIMAQDLFVRNSKRNKL